MGNAESLEDCTEPIETANSSDEPLASTKPFDLSVLLDNAKLQQSLGSSSEPVEGEVLRHRDQLLTWLRGLIRNNESVVSSLQFAEEAVGFGVTRKNAVDFFNSVDRYGSGQLQCSALVSALQESSSRSILQACSPCIIAPGAVDVYGEKGKTDNNMGSQLMQFLQRNKAASDLLSLPGYEASLTQFSLREKLVHSRYVNWKKTDEEQDKPGDEHGQQLMDIKKCYSKITVSSSEKSIDNLLDSNSSTYWQSNGSPRRHWIRFHMLPGVMIKELAITVNQSDDSYMPKKLAVLVGNSEGNLRDLKELEVPRNLTGKFVVAKGIRAFRYVQLSIKGCHSDGCDTRIRGISVKGCKFVEEKKPQVMDTLVVWHLSMLASTAQMSLSVSPTLKDTLISQSHMAFQQLKPLILSSSSSQRPDFLSSFVLEEMSRFLDTLCNLDDQATSHNVKSLEMLLYFSVASGNMNNILHTLRLLQADPTQIMGVASLLHSLDEVLLQKRQAHADQLKVIISSCSGGNDDQAEKILSNQMNSGTAYNSKSGKTDMVVVIKDKDGAQFEVHKLIIKVPAGDNGVKEGYVFTASSPDDVQQLEALDLKEDTATLKAAIHFTIDTDTHTAEVTIATAKPDKLLVIRFLSDQSADHASIHCVQLYGYMFTEQELWYSEHLPVSSPLPPSGEPVASSSVVEVMLSMLVGLAQDRQVLWRRLSHSQMDTTLSVEAHLEVEQLSLQEVWLLYQQLIGQKVAVKCLQLLHCCLPFLEAKRKPASNSDKDNNIATEVLSHLCSVMDKQDDDVVDDVTKKLSHDIIRDGIVVFFPDSAARRTYLISMLDSVMSEELPTSWWLKFEALCIHFSSQDPNSLLGLPVTDKNNSEVLAILKTIITIATRDAMSMETARCSDLVQLLGSLQATLLFWCHKNWEGQEACQAPLVNQYVIQLADQCLKVLQKVETHDDKMAAINHLQQSLLATVLPQLLYLLNPLLQFTEVQPYIMRNLFPLVTAINKLISATPELSMGLETSGADSESIIDVVIVESPHNYHNSTKISQDYSFDEASRLVIEFDTRCTTEVDCDVLTFTTPQGNTQRCHGKAGSDNWPKSLEFTGGKLSFSFESDSSNTEWGYRFCIKVYSKLKKSFHWLFDLHLSLSRLLGQVCSSALSEPAVTDDKDKAKQEGEEVLLRSDVWKTLFRGGYQVGKLTRSLSGAHSTTPSESRLNNYLVDMTTGETTCSLLEQCRQGQTGQLPPQYGGENVDKAVNAIFASLIWHCQDLREEVSDFVTAMMPSKLSPQLLKAYQIAQDMRRELVEARRKVVEEHEGESSSDPVNEDAPIIACYEKAIFLLKFSGLTKVTGANIQQVSPSSRSSWLRKSVQWRKMGSFDGKSNKLTHQVSIIEESSEEMDPSIKMVLDFVKDERITKDQVQSLLQYRHKRAKTIAHVFIFSADFLRVFLPNIFQLPAIVFLQQLLSLQKSFPPHYASKLDGCGLEIENEVRKAYYVLLTRLIDAVRSCRSQDASGTFPPSYYLIKSYLLHLLDMNWQEYDNLFILEQQLPELFLETSITSFKPTEKIDVFPMETELMERYQMQSQMKEMLLELKSFNKVLEHFKDFDPQKELHYFLVTAIHVVPNVIMVTCDGCGARISSQWYRSLEVSENCDLCQTCFNDGTGSRPDDHKPEHNFIRLGRFICDGCRMLIWSHRFHSNTREDYDLCLGCYRADGGLGDQWTYYPLTLQPLNDKRSPYYSTNPEESEGMLLENNSILKPGKLTNIRTYNHQHAFLLFSSLCLNISGTLATKRSTTSNQDYRQSAVNIHLSCLKLLTFCLRASLCGAADNTAMIKEKEKQAAALAAAEAAAKAAEAAAKAAAEKADEENDHKESGQDDGSQGDGNQGDNSKGDSAQGDVKKNDGSQGDGKQGDSKGDSAQGDVKKNDSSQGDSNQVDGSPNDNTIDATDGDKSKATPTDTTATPTDTTATPTDTTATTTDTVATTSDIVETATDTMATTTDATATTNDTMATTTDTMETTTDTRTTTTDSTSIVAKGDSNSSSSVTLQDQRTTLQSLHSVTSQDTSTDPETRKHFGEAEKHFSFHSLEKILGLLASIIPNESSLSSWSSASRVFLVDRLLPVLLNVSHSVDINPQQQLQAILLLARYISKLQPQDGDKIISKVESCDPPGEVTAGVSLVRHFFSLGADCLRKSDFSGAAAVAEVLNILSEVTAWKNVVTIVISDCFNVPRKVELSSLFGLMVTGGFPNLLRIGCVVEVTGSEDGKAVVTDLSSIQSATIVNLSSRVVSVVPRKDLEMTKSLAGCANTSQLSHILRLLNHIVVKRSDKSLQAVELNWMTSLLLKSLYLILQDGKGREVIRAILDANVLPTIVRLASLPTHMSQKWLLSDLEVLGVHVYHPSNDDATVASSESEEGTSTQTAPMVRSSSIKENDPLVGVPDNVKEIISNMQEVFNCSAAILRAMYELAEQNLEKWMELVQGCYDDGAFKPNEEAVTKAKDWEPASVQEVVQQIQDSANDNGVLLFTAITTDLKNMTAAEESNSSLKVQLMGGGASGTKKDSQQQDKDESHELLQTELKNDTPSTREEMLKVNKALVVLHSRQLLASVLAQWQGSDCPLNCRVLGGISIMQLFCLLDLLVRCQASGTADKILQSLVSCGEQMELLQLSLTAAQCMGEVSVGTKCCQSKHPLSSDDVVEDHVTIPNASSLVVTFDPKCSISGELTLSSDESFSKHVKTYKNTAAWPKHIVPGDTVYYKVTSPSGGSSDHWGWSFTVLGSQVGRFDTGYLLLSNLLRQSQKATKQPLPFKKLWPWLSAVACQHTGGRRLQTIKLLMELLHIQLQPSHASPVAASSSGSTERVELAVLKPLWQLYTSMLKKYDDDSQQGNTLIPEIIRALTELFLLVENIAEEWGVAQDHLIDMLTTEGLNTWLEKGISNVALVSISLGLDNKASQIFLEAKRNYVPVKEQPKNSDDDKGSSPSSSSDEDDSFDDDDDDDEEDYLYSDSS